jgi:DNA polymerase
MLMMGKPKRDGTAWHTDPSATVQAKLQELGEYCRRDVMAERAIDRVIPKLHVFEKRLSEADARINQKGVLIDIEAVAALADAVAIERAKINAEAHLLSGGAVSSPGTETAKLLEWLRVEGNPLPDLTKETVAAALGGALYTKPRRMLELRKLAAKASASKLERMLAWASTADQRARNLLQFYGAGRTGRWAGRGIQVQNLPRPMKGLVPQDVIDVAQKEPQALGLFHESPLDAIKGSLRACLVAREGHVLISIDLSQIEARVLAWLAGQHDVLAAFTAGTDVYVLQAGKVGSKDRQLGKVLTLACGYGMGWIKFKETAWEQYGLSLTPREAQEAVSAYRAANDKIVAYWRAVAVDVSAAMAKPGTVIQMLRGMQCRVKGGLLEIRKPNSVKLRYHNIRWDGEDGMVFDGVDSTTKQWGKQRTYGGKLVENIVQSVARDVMAEGFLKADVHPVMTVHDEAVWEWPEATAKAAADELQQRMETVPAWAGGLPLASEIKISRRYGK